MKDLAHLIKLGAVKRYAADETFFQEGDLGNTMYVILTGRVEVLSGNIEGSFTRIAQLKAGDFFGEMSFLEKQPRSTTVSAVEETIVLELSERNFNYVISRNPEVAYNIMKELSGRIRGITEDLDKANDRGNGRDMTLSEPDRKDRLLEPPMEEDAQFFMAPQQNNYQPNTEIIEGQYLFEKDITCPICEKSFPVSMIRSSKLRLKGLDPDLRQIYEEFDPLWYMVWACPHCGYANFYYQFRQVNELLKTSLLNEYETDQDKEQKISYSVPRKFSEVLRSYYLCYRALKLGNAASSDLAKFWLRLSWLYRDAGDEALYHKASQKALEYYLDTYFKSRFTSAEQDSRICLLLGELYLKLKNHGEALRFYRKAINRKTGSASINRQAEDRINEVVQLNRKMGESGLNKESQERAGNNKG